MSTGDAQTDVDQRWQRMILGLRAGDQQIVREFCDEYGAMMHSLAEKHLASGLRRRIGPEDVVQSACRTFLRRAKGGEFALSDSDELWRLVCAITLTKVREQARFHLRKKRGLQKETTPSPDMSLSGIMPAAQGPTPEDAAEFADQFRELMSTLNEEEQQLVQLKLDDCTNEEAAQQLGCSERTVRRILKQVQSRLARVFELSLSG
jgi:RNA polymerase sigma factor (sigma-70 family)